MVVVDGKVRGKARPKFSNGHVFTPSTTVEYENWIRFNYQQQSGKFLNGPIKAQIIIYYAIPNSYSKKRIKNILEEKEFPCKKPDIDNIVKCVLDSLNLIAYKDDSQIVELYVSKKYTQENERLEFELTEILESEISVE